MRDHGESGAGPVWPPHPLTCVPAYGSVMVLPVLRVTAPFRAIGSVFQRDGTVEEVAAAWTGLVQWTP